MRRQADQIHRQYPFPRRSYRWQRRVRDQGQGHGRRSPQSRASPRAWLDQWSLWQRTQPVAKEAIPTQTYDSNYGPVLQAGGRTAVVGHPNSAHTDTDSWVIFPDANVLAMGDTTSLGPRYPTIDYANGGSINGIINTVNNYLAMTNGQTKYMPGHGPLATRADIVIATC